MVVEFECGACGALVPGSGRYCPYCGVQFEFRRFTTRQWNDPVIANRGSSASTGARWSE